MGPNVITDGTFIMLGSKCYYRYDSLYMVIWHHGSCDQVEREKNEQEKISQNLKKGYQFKLWQIYNWLWNVLLNKIHHFRRNRYVIRVLLYKHDVRLINSFQPSGIWYYFFSSVFPFFTAEFYWQDFMTVSTCTEKEYY